MKSDTFLNTFLMSLASLPGPSSAKPQQLTAVSVPSQCSDICRPIVELTGTCNVNMEVTMKMNMSAEEMKADMDCVCQNTSFDVKGIMGLCASCMSENAGSGNQTAVQNIGKIMSGCSFPTTSYAPSATTALAGVKVEATKPVMTMTMWNNTASQGNGTAESSSKNSNMAGMSSSMAGMSMGAAGRVEIGAGVFSAGMIMASFGFGVALVLGSL